MYRTLMLIGGAIVMLGALDLWLTGLEQGGLKHSSICDIPRWLPHATARGQPARSSAEHAAEKLNGQQPAARLCAGPFLPE